MRSPLPKLSEIVSARSSARFVNVATPPKKRRGSTPRAGLAVHERRRYETAVVRRLDIAESVLLINQRLDSECLPGRRRRRRLCMHYQLAGPAGLTTTLVDVAAASALP